MDEVPDSEIEYWDAWNAENRAATRDETALDQASVILGWIGSLRRTDLRIVEVGCGTGWFVDQLLPYGEVTGLDLSRDVLRVAQERNPTARFVSADILQSTLPGSSYDVVVTLETLAHVADQRRFMRELARLAVPGGRIMIAVQNADVLGTHGRVPPRDPRARRDWPTPARMRDLAQDVGDVLELRTITPLGDASWRRVLTSKRLRNALGSTGRRWHHYLERRGWGRTIMVDIRRTR